MNERQVVKQRDEFMNERQVVERVMFYVKKIEYNIY